MTHNEVEMRKAFSEYAIRQYHNMALTPDGDFIDSYTQDAFLDFCAGWKASRAALVVELPISVCRTHVFELPHTNEVGMEHSEYYEIDDVKKSLEAAGVKYK